MPVLLPEFEMPLVAWFVLFGLIAVVSMYVYRAHSHSASENGQETAHAILQFGKAFPMEPIRDVLLTWDTETAFLRLNGGKTGCISAQKRHAVCRILEPGSVSVMPGDNDRSLFLDFGALGITSGRYLFRSPKEAAEISLWLLDSFVKQPETSEDEIEQ
jgi:hypothetical protein